MNSQAAAEHSAEEGEKASIPYLVKVQGRSFIPPQSALARSIVMGTEATEAANMDAKQQKKQPRNQPGASNLTLLLSQQSDGDVDAGR